MPEQADTPVSEFIDPPDYEGVAADCGMCLCAFAAATEIPLKRIATFVAGEAEPNACEILAMCRVVNEKAPRRAGLIGRLREAGNDEAVAALRAEREAVAAALEKVFADAEKELEAEGGVA